MSWCGSDIFRWLAINRSNKEEVEGGIQMTAQVIFIVSLVVFFVVCIAVDMWINGGQE